MRAVELYRVCCHMRCPSSARHVHVRKSVYFIYSETLRRRCELDNLTEWWIAYDKCVSLLVKIEIVWAMECNVITSDWRSIL